MKRVSQNPFSLLLLLAFFALLGCGVDATKDDDPMVGSIVHRDFPCIMGGTVGPVTIKPSWPMTGESTQQRIYPGSIVGEFLVKNHGQKPAKLEGALKVLLLGNTLNKLDYRVFLKGNGWWGWITPEVPRSADGSVEWTILQNTTDAMVGGGEEVKLGISLSESITNGPVSGDVWQGSMPEGGLTYGTAPTCAGAEEKHGLKADGRPILGQVVNTKF